MKYLHLFLAFVVLFSFSSKLQAQTPSSCFEIESILVDACGSPESANEMMRIHIGSTDLLVSDMTITWSSNPFLGICQNATTAQAVAAFNRTIIHSCGLLVEPTAGVLPAGRQVIIITSTDCDTLANNFDGLEDTMWVIFQCPGAGTGHFRNYSSTPGTRTTSISFSSPGGCSDAATYDISLLTTPAGTHAAADGARVDFAWDGTPSYYNYGCVAPIIIVSADAGPDTSTCPRQPVSLSATITGGNHFIWTGGNGTFSHADSLHTRYTPSASDVYPINLYFHVYNNCRDTAIDTITVFSFPDTSGVTPLVTGCAGTRVNLNAHGGIAYNWVPADGSLSCTNCPNPLITISSSRVYAVTITLAGGCTVTDSVYVRLSSHDSVSTAFHDTTICNGNNIALSAYSSNGYNWTPTATLSCSTCASPVASPTTNTWYHVSSSGACAWSDSVLVRVLPAASVNAGRDTFVCSGDSIRLTATGVASVLWSSTAGSGIITCPSCLSTFVHPAVNTVFYVTNTTAGTCAARDTVRVTVVSAGAVFAGNDTSICSGSSLRLNPTGSGGYNWSSPSGSSSLSCTSCTNPIVTPSGTTLYIVTAGAGSCLSRDSIIVRTIPTPTLNAFPDTSICSGKTAALNVNGAAAYQWQLISGSSTLSCSACASPIVTGNTTSTFLVYNTDGACHDSTTITLNVTAAPTLNAGNDTSICLGAEANLNGTGSASIQWNTTGDYNTIGCPSCASTTVHPAVTTTYFIYNGGLCVSYDSVRVNVTSGPSINAGVDTTIHQGQSVSLMASGASSYVWSPSSGLNSSTAANPTASPLSTITYIVTGTDANGCKNIDSITITVIPDQNCTPVFPDAFTPNGDGLNDAFKLINNNSYSSYSMVIINRWGEKVFETNNSADSWNGLFNGTAQAVGTYIYLATGTCLNGETFKQNGAVSLIR
jgi:gliding motility-associated-like protein